MVVDLEFEHIQCYIRYINLINQFDLFLFLNSKTTQFWKCIDT